MLRVIISLTGYQPKRDATYVHENISLSRGTHFPPETIQWAAYDHSLAYSRENSGEMVAPKGTPEAGLIELNSGDKARHTVVLFSSSDGFARNPEIMFKATDPQRLKDIDWARAPTDITIQFPPTATYDAETTEKTPKENSGFGEYVILSAPKNIINTSGGIPRGSAILTENKMEPRVER